MSILYFEKIAKTAKPHKIAIRLEELENNKFLITINSEYSNVYLLITIIIT